MVAANAARRASHMDMASTRCRLRRQDAEANGEAGPKGVPQERHVTRMGALLFGMSKISSKQNRAILRGDR